ncbi:MAG: hypothetical protein ACK4FF_08895 [Limnobacter sp.]|uniref:hypothetical protein n=1 Tax=Limnobacter sp. TaxID=2003368 RepID=UPI00391C28AA
MNTTQLSFTHLTLSVPPQFITFLEIPPMPTLSTPTTIQWTPTSADIERGQPVAEAIEENDGHPTMPAGWAAIVNGAYFAARMGVASTSAMAAHYLGLAILESSGHQQFRGIASVGDFILPALVGGSVVAGGLGFILSTINSTNPGCIPQRFRNALYQ